MQQPETGRPARTFTEVARRAGITKSVISYHFADKNEHASELAATFCAATADPAGPRHATPGADS